MTTVRKHTFWLGLAASATPSYAPSPLGPRDPPGMPACLSHSVLCSAPHTCLENVSPHLFYILLFGCLPNLPELSLVMKVQGS